MNKRIPLSEPIFSSSEKTYVNKCIETGWVSTAGKLIEKFENKFKQLVSSKYAVACNSGTSALHLALKSLEIKKNEIVIVSNLTFIASVNVIKYIGAEPILIDCCKKTAQMDYKLLQSFLREKCFVDKKRCKLKKNNKTISALIIVHLYGHSANITMIKKIAKKFYLKIIEDAAESVGVKYKNKHLGTFGDVGCFSFNGNKIITSGSGGMLVTNNFKIAKKSRHLAQQAKSKDEQISYDGIGYNYKMNNLCAALGIAQLQKLETFIKRKNKIASVYMKLLSGLNGINFIEPIKECKSTWWLFNIIFDKRKSSKSIGEIQKILQKKQIESRRIWRPIHQTQPYRNTIIIGGENSNYLFENTLSLPSSVGLTTTQQKKIVEIIKDAIT